MTNTLLLSVLLAACGDKESDSGVAPLDDTQATTPDLPDYSQPGDYSVGTFSAEITGSTGVEFTVQVWHPADAPGSETVVYDGLYPGDAYTDTAPSCDESRPVLLFSHGYGGIRWQSGFLVEHLASHGYIVVAPDHTNNTFLDNDDSEFEAILLRRPQDIIDSFDWALSQSEDTSSSLSGCIDGAAGYAVSGHSFGGYTAYAVAGATLDDQQGGTINLSDDRAWAVVPLAPWDAYVLTSGATATVDVPVMCLSGTLDETTTWASVTAMYDDLTATPRYLGEFPTAGHFSFSPIACDFGTTGDGCGDDFLSLDTFTGLVNTATLSFLQETRGFTGAIEQIPQSDDVIWSSTD